MTNFWKHLPEPFLVLAPMEDVTDVVFREIVAGLPRPDVFFTEFTSSDGLASKGREETIQRFKYTEYQRPIVAQIWGINPKYMYEAAKLVKDLGFDGVDINMGCPVPAVMKHGAGAGMIGNYSLSKEIIDAVKVGADGIPVSVKTRLGIDTIITHEWIPFLLEQKIDALTIHGRTAEQLSKGSADWNEVEKIVELKNKISPDTIIIGNGDIKGYKEAIEIHEKHGVDGIMIGRGIFSNPWVFEKTMEPTYHDKEDYISLLQKHIELYDKTWGDTKNFDVIKKFFKMYVKSFDGANELRMKLMECKNRIEVENILKSFLTKTNSTRSSTHTAEYESWNETNDILADPAIVKAIKTGEKEINARKGIPWEKVKKELDLD